MNTRYLFLFVIHLCDSLYHHLLSGGVCINQLLKSRTMREVRTSLIKTAHGESHRYLSRHLLSGIMGRGTPCADFLRASGPLPFGLGVSHVGAAQGLRRVASPERLSGASNVSATNSPFGATLTQSLCQAVPGTRFSGASTNASTHPANPHTRIDTGLRTFSPLAQISGPLGRSGFGRGIVLIL
jgi:hypothetical protein